MPIRSARRAPGGALAAAACAPVEGCAVRDGVAAASAGLAAASAAADATGVGVEAATEGSLS